MTSRLSDYNQKRNFDVTPYALRARPGAPVAAPLDWSELARRDLHSQTYTVRNIFRRLAQKEEPMAAMFDHARPLPQISDF